jgi:hypothetical protein
MIRLTATQILDLHYSLKSMLSNGFALETALYCLSVPLGSKLHSILMGDVQSFKDFPDSFVTLVDAI